MKFIVLLSCITTDSKEPDIQDLKLEIESTNCDSAINKAINHYYEKYWTNSNNNKELYEDKIKSFKSKLDVLKSQFKLEDTNLNILLKEYSTNLRQEIGGTDISVEEFNDLNISNKISYLYEIGLDLNYYCYSKNTKFIKEII